MFSESFFNGLYIIPVLAVLILVHEFGHFFAARACGVKVEEFGIGIPPRIKGWNWRGVLWSVNAIPFGGFVRVKGEDGRGEGEPDKQPDPDSMNAKPPHQRAFFLASGAAMNILLAVILMIVVVGVEGVPHQRSYISYVAPGSPAAKAGWKVGDRLVEVNGNAVDRPSQFAQATRRHAGDEIEVIVERRGQLVTTRVTPREDPPEGEGRVGVGMDARYVANVTLEEVAPGSPAALAGLQAGDRLVSINGRAATDFFVLQSELERFIGFGVPIEYERGGQIVATELEVPRDVGTSDIYDAVGLPRLTAMPIFEDVPLLEVVPRGFEEAYNATVAMINGIRELFSSRENLSQIAGPIGMGQLTSELVEESPFSLWMVLANLAIILSLNLAILNLLPLPALDGGRLLFVLIEVLRGGRRIAPEKEGLVHFAGLVILIGLMFVVGFFDINRIIDGRSFIP